MNAPFGRHLAWQQTSHNPEVAGSNPAPATHKGPWKHGLSSPADEDVIAFDVPLALAIVGLVIVLAPSSVAGLAPPI
jgi:hypothetical protein